MAFHLVPQPKPRPRALGKHDDKRDLDAQKRRVNAEVDARDGKRCLCCSRRGNPNATTTLGRIHRAHITDASRGGPYEAWNLASLCWICHALEHARLLWFIGRSVTPKLRFEIARSVVKDVFGDREIPKHVKVV